jgi:hypothetical protein
MEKESIFRTMDTKQLAKYFLSGLIVKRPERKQKEFLNGSSITFPANYKPRIYF